VEGGNPPRGKHLRGNGSSMGGWGACSPRQGCPTKEKEVPPSAKKGNLQGWGGVSFPSEDSGRRVDLSDGRIKDHYFPFVEGGISRQCCGRKKEGAWQLRKRKNPLLPFGERVAWEGSGKVKHASGTRPFTKGKKHSPGERPPKRLQGREI